MKLSAIMMEALASRLKQKLVKRASELGMTVEELEAKVESVSDELDVAQSLRIVIEAWILNKVNNFDDEYLAGLTRSLSTWLSKLKTITKKNINDYSPEEMLDTFRPTVEPWEEELKRHPRVSQQPAAPGILTANPLLRVKNPLSLPGVSLVQKKGPLKVFVITDPDSLREMGEGSRWCTRKSFGGTNAENYLTHSPQAIATYNNRLVFQFATLVTRMKMGDAKDVNDHTVEITDLARAGIDLTVEQIMIDNTRDNPVEYAAVVSQLHKNGLGANLPSDYMDKYVYNDPVALKEYIFNAIRNDRTGQRDTAVEKAVLKLLSEVENTTNPIDKSPAFLLLAQYVRLRPTWIEGKKFFEDNTPALELMAFLRGIGRFQGQYFNGDGMTPIYATRDNRLNPDTEMRLIKEAGVTDLLWYAYNIIKENTSQDSWRRFWRRVAPGQPGKAPAAWPEGERAILEKYAAEENKDLRRLYENQILAYERDVYGGNWPALRDYLSSFNINTVIGFVANRRSRGETFGPNDLVSSKQRAIELMKQGNDTQAIALLQAAYGDPTSYLVKTTFDIKVNMQGQDINAFAANSLIIDDVKAIKELTSTSASRDNERLAIIRKAEKVIPSSLCNIIEKFLNNAKLLWPEYIEEAFSNPRYAENLLETVVDTSIGIVGLDLNVIFRGHSDLEMKVLKNAYTNAESDSKNADASHPMTTMLLDTIANDSKATAKHIARFKTNWPAAKKAALNSPEDALRYALAPLGPQTYAGMGKSHPRDKDIERVMRYDTSGQYLKIYNSIFGTNLKPISIDELLADNPDLSVDELERLIGSV